MDDNNALKKLLVKVGKTTTSNLDLNYFFLIQLSGQYLPGRGQWAINKNHD